MHGQNDSSNQIQICHHSSKMKLGDYVLLSREERTKHIDLTTECELGKLDKRQRGGLNELYDILGVEDDIDSFVAARIHVCHLCECGRRKGECGNPRHIYIGTAQENALDNDKEFRLRRGRAMISARKEWKPDPNREKFLADVNLDPSLLSVASRKLAEVYSVSHFTIQRWKRLAG